MVLRVLRSIRRAPWSFLYGRYSSKSAASVKKEPSLDVNEFAVEKIRNFSIVAHIDHGKSTLADRLLEWTGTVDRVREPQMLDRLEVERQRGITVKAQTATMFCQHQGATHMLNLIDTPGHVDFHFEVARSLAACDGVILLIDANQGVQAQTVANFWLAFEKELPILAVLNKIDLKLAKHEVVEQQLADMFDIIPEQTLRISAKLGTGIPELVSAIFEQIPSPSGNRQAPFKAFIFDSSFVHFRGAIASVIVKDGSVAAGDSILALHSGRHYEVSEVGIMQPDPKAVQRLHAGQVGYIVSNMRTVQEAQVGGTLCSVERPVEALPGFRPAKPMVFAGLFPVDPIDHAALRQSVEKLALNDPAVTVDVDSSQALGQGWRMGFLGLLHMEVFGQRLDQEYDASVILTAPTVKYKATIKNNEGIRRRLGGEAELVIKDPAKFPDPSDIEAFHEPIVLATIICPGEFLDVVTTLCLGNRGSQVDARMTEGNRAILRFKLPLVEVVTNFFDVLKQATSGYASFDYEDIGFMESDVVKLMVALNGRQIEEFSRILPQSSCRTAARELVGRLAEEIPRQTIDVEITASVGKKRMASRLIKAYKKDFTQKLKGNFGDITRLKKLLKHQEEGKQRMKMINQVNIPKEAFIKILQLKSS